MSLLTIDRTIMFVIKTEPFFNLLFLLCFNQNSSNFQINLSIPEMLDDKIINTPKSNSSNSSSSFFPRKILVISRIISENFSGIQWFFPKNSFKCKNKIHSRFVGLREQGGVSTARAITAVLSQAGPDWDMKTSREF